MDAAQRFDLDGDRLSPTAEAVCAHCPSIASKTSTSSALKSRCSVVTPGVCWRVKPSAHTTASDCSRPHCALAYRLRAPPSRATVANASGRRRHSPSLGLNREAPGLQLWGVSLTLLPPRPYALPPMRVGVRRARVPRCSRPQHARCVWLCPCHPSRGARARRQAQLRPSARQ